MAATDQRGYYEFHDVLPGKYTLKVAVTGFQTVSWPVVVREGEFSNRFPAGTCGDEARSKGLYGHAGM
jgi:hypothetical protein